MGRVRPSLRKLEKAERQSQGGSGFKSTYEARQAARKRVLARLTAALDRIDVASQFDEFSGSTIAQIGHAERFLRSDARDESEEGWPFAVSADVAHDLAQRLAHLFHDAYVSELMDRATARAAEPNIEDTQLDLGPDGTAYRSRPDEP